MRSPENLEQVCSLKPDMVGYIFYEESKRFVGAKPEPALFQIPGPGIRKVGVFVNESLDFVRRSCESGQLHLVQLHGNESTEYCSLLAKEGIPVIKALDVETEVATMEAYSEQVHYVLFDTPGQGYGGTGRKFDWDLLKRVPESTPFLLSGGIGPGDAGTVLDIDHEGFHGIDLNSRFELEPGLKDVEALKDFMELIRKH